MASSRAGFREYMGLLKELNIPLYLNCKLEEITDKSIICSNTQTSVRVEFPADTVLLAMGMTARHDIADSLRRSAPETEVFVVGDAVNADTIASAVMSSFKAAAYI
ncbi:MAG: NADH:flavin oxidoreductase, partial [Firmicutes bacterium]|nr:NADH:flavin oxidoreductase [Bacillota bacterium]